jgi:hypothetical protein
MSKSFPGYGCQTTFLKIIEEWKLSLGQNKYIAAVLMNLSNRMLTVL